MPLRYKVDILEALKKKGLSTYTLKKHLSQSTIQKLRDGEGIGWKNIEVICRLLECQPGDIIEYIPDEE